MRWGEVASLNWENVLPAGVRVAATYSKTRRERVVPMGKTVLDVVQRARNTDGRVIGGEPAEIHDDLCAWLRDLGVKDQKPAHYLRKCYGSLAVADIGVFTASRLLGHASIQMTASTYAGQVDKLPPVNLEK